MERKRFKQKPVDNAENGGVRSNAKSERDDCRKRKAGRLAYLAHGVADIPQHGLHRLHLVEWRRSLSDIVTHLRILEP
jgi:hypothetical protein